MFPMVQKESEQNPFVFLSILCSRRVTDLQVEFNLSLKGTCESLLMAPGAEKVMNNQAYGL